MENITAKTDYDGVASPAPGTAVHTSRQYNDRRSELQGAVEDSGQTLASADPTQLSKALFANGVAAQSMQDNSATASVVELTPITGPSGLRVSTPTAKDYSLLDGAIFNFKANTTNTGDMSVNIGQAVGSYIGSQSLYLSDGTTQVPVGKVVSGRYYSVRYDLTGTKFILMDSSVYAPEKYVGGESVTLPNGLIMKFGKTATPTGNHPGGDPSVSVIFAAAFPSGVLSVTTNVKDSYTNASVLTNPSVVSVTGITIRYNERVGVAQIMDGIYWQAIGY